MSDRLKANLLSEAERVEVPYADSAAIVGAGRSRLIRRRIAATTAIAILLVGAGATARLIEKNAFSSEVAPADAPTPSSFEIPPEYADEVAAILEEQRLLTAAFNRGDFEHLRELAEARLAEATDPEHWDYGNAIHEGHLILGHVELREGDLDAARFHLLAAGRTPGSPRLDSFGPNMSLARDMLLEGERKAVMKYLGLIGRFWERHDAELSLWKRYVRRGGMPDFGSNLHDDGIDPPSVDQARDCPGCRLPPARN